MLQVEGIVCDSPMVEITWKVGQSSDRQVGSKFREVIRSPVNHIKAFGQS